MLAELKHHSCAAVTLLCWIRLKVCKDAWAAMPIWAQLSWGPLWLFCVPLHPAIQPGKPILRAALWSPAPPTSFLTSHSASSHPALGRLLRSTYPNMHPAWMSTKGHFVISYEHLSAKPLLVNILGASPCLADDVAAESRARHVWELAGAREESIQTFHLQRDWISLTCPMSRFGGDCHHKQCALFSWLGSKSELKPPLLAGWVFSSCFQEIKKKSSPRAHCDKLSLFHLSSKSSRDIISPSSWYRNNIYLSCSQYTASVMWCVCTWHIWMLGMMEVSSITAL